MRAHIDSINEHKGNHNNLLQKSNLQSKEQKNVQKGQAQKYSKAGFDFSEISILPRNRVAIQPKLKINEPNDKYEQEADLMADKVIKGLSAPSSEIPTIQRKCESCDNEEYIQKKELEDESKLNQNVVSPDSVLLENEDRIQAKLNKSITKTKGNRASQMKGNLRNSNGRPLPKRTKEIMEASFQRDFSDVKIYSDTNSAIMNDAIGAKAFTHKSNIFFGKGQFKPNAKDGLKLIAHELTHTIQQKSNFNNKPDIQKSEAETLRLCPPYWRWETPRNVETFNCTGLAQRTYRYIGNISATEGHLTRNGRQSSVCNEGEVKHWLWTYDMYGEHLGNRVFVGRDFHTVAGVAGSGGSNPTDVYSKNGKRPVYGPNTGPSFKPASREQDRENNRNQRLRTDPQGNPIYKVRANMREVNFCLPCPSPRRTNTSSKGKQTE